MQRKEATTVKHTSTVAAASDRRKAKVTNATKTTDEKKPRAPEQPKSTNERKAKSTSEKSHEQSKQTGEKKPRDQQKLTGEKKPSTNPKPKATNGKAAAPRADRAAAEARPANVERTKSKATKPTAAVPPPAQPAKPLKSTAPAARRNNAPLKASHSIGARPSAPIKMSAKNVMNQVHNVTVSSPPPERRQVQANGMEREPSEHRAENGSRERTRTRTLGEDEIVLLKPTPAASQPMRRAIEPAARPPEVKPSVTFDVPVSGQPKLPEPANVQRVEAAASASEDEYEDDFESYESDFESDVSSNVTSSADDTLSTGDSSTDDNLVSTSSRHPFDQAGGLLPYNDLGSDSFELKTLPSQAKRADSADSKSVHNSLPSIGRSDLALEMPSNTSGVGTSLQSQNSQIDSLDSPSHHGSGPAEIDQTKSDAAPAPRKSSLAKRGEDLLRKITLDDMSYVLFDCKPIPYDLFMKIYGNSDTAQAAVQTHNNRIDQECQCDRTVQRTAWTQCPVGFNTSHINGRHIADYKRGCGQDEQMAGAANSTDSNMGHMFDDCLRMIRNASTTGKGGGSGDGRLDCDTSGTSADINYVSLNRFLVESELTLSRIIDADVRALAQSPLQPICDGYFTLDMSALLSLRAMKLQRLFVHGSLPGFLFTLHVDGAAGDLNVIAVWDLLAIRTPMCLLSVWSGVRCVEIHPSLRNVIYAGLDDG